MADGKRTRRIETKEGTLQGAVIIRLTANIYLHHVYDQWVHQWRKLRATGDVIVVRYADDSVVGLGHRHDAEQFFTDLKERLARTESSSREDAAHRVWSVRDCEPPRPRPETFDLRLARVQASAITHVRRDNDKDLHASERNPRRYTERERVRRVFEDRLTLGSFAYLPDMRSRRLLR
jgi:hypothetical protein